MNDIAFAKAVAVVMGYEYLDGKCKKNPTLSIEQIAQIETWQNKNHVEFIQNRINQLISEGSANADIEKARSQVASSFQKIPNEYSCKAVISLTQMPQSQLAANNPELFIDLNSPPVATKPKVNTNKHFDNQASNNTKLIDSFAFDSRPTMGIGGFIGLDIYPIVLFKNGEALTEIKGLSAISNIALHKKSNPSEWTQWRRKGNQLQILKDATWETMEFQSTYQQLPKNMPLNGLYRATSGTGNVAFGGTSSVAAWDEYVFSKNGSVLHNHGAGSYSESGDTSVATSGSKGNTHGQYHIEGLTLQIIYEDGSKENRIIVTDPKDPNGVIWLDGQSYVQRKK